MLLASTCLSAPNAIHQLGSLDQRVREQAARELRIENPSPDRDRWTMLLRELRPGQSRSECLVRLGPATNTLMQTYGQMGFFSEECRLDDFYVLRLTFSRTGPTLHEAQLLDVVRHIWVPPPKGFTGTWTVYFVNGRKSHEIEYRAGSYHGTFTSYHPNGHVACQQHYGTKGTEGEDTGYYDTGEVSYRGQYSAGRQVGEWIWYSRDGSIKSRRNFGFAQPDGPANGSQPIRSETNRTSSAAGSRR